MQRFGLVFSGGAGFVLFVLGILSAGCGPTTKDLSAVNYAAHSNGLFQVSTPEEEGVDRSLLDDLYWNASRLENVYGVLVFKNNRLVAEQYFHGGAPDQQVNIHSVTKSINSSLVGIALERGDIKSLDQPMMAFFPELADQVKDPRRNEITIRQMLQMRAGYPWEESTEELFNLLMTGFHNDTLIRVPLVRDPGTGFEYSNLTSHILGQIVARATGIDLKSYAQENLFSPLGIEPGFWQQDWDGNYLGFSDLHLTARDLARFGQLYMNDGQYNGVQVVPSQWVHDSLQTYSSKAWKFRVGRNWKDNAYGYQWWSVQAGNYRYNMAWGHGGQQIILLPQLDMMLVITVDPLHLQHGGGPWKKEKAALNLVADFVASLPVLQR
ncbi:MAG: serine hydrolase [Pontiellaceae bacterium]|nr:serine hydrolase [Pontiellaceae bacterium]MBN2784666.1 serine hydrolase [Pontiellaceae bacterium]